MIKERNTLPGSVAAAFAAISLIAVFIAGPVCAAGKDAAPNQKPASFDDLKVKTVYLLGSKKTTRAGIDDTIVVEIDKPDALSGRVAFPNSTSIALYLDNRPLKGVYAESVDDRSGTLQFRLSREADNPENVKEWATLLGKPIPYSYKGFLERPTAVTIGVKGKSPRASDVTRDKFSIQRMSKWPSLLCAGLFFVILVLFGLAWSRTDLLRDFGPELLDKDKGKKKPFSLARMQMALWTLIIIASALFIWLITGDHNLVTLNVLGYMGISATAAGWAMKIDEGKGEGFKKKVDAKKDKLTAKQAEISSLEKEKKKLEEESDKLEKSKKALYTDLEKLKPKADAIKGQEDEIKSADENITSNRTRIDDIASQLAELDNKITTLNEKKERLEKEKEKLETDKAALQEEIKDLKAKTPSDPAAIKQKEDEIKSVDENITSSAKEIKGIASQLAELNNKTTPLKNDKKQVEEEKEKHEADRVLLDKDIKDLKAQTEIIKNKDEELKSTEENLKSNENAKTNNDELLKGLNAEKDKLEKDITELTVSQGWIKDLFSDINGNSLHRYQLAAWTLVLVIVFVSEVWKNLAMPEFDGTTLLLMGFSSGAYLWFKNQPGTEQA